jgi:L-ascorbate metabolism protein UlaG (beta-lactamase superfamily)
MPTLLRFGGFRVVIYPNDHRPAHVHVVGGGGQAVFLLNCPGGPVALRGTTGHSTAALNGIEAALSGAVKALRGEWERLHGYY